MNEGKGECVSLGEYGGDSAPGGREVSRSLAKINTQHKVGKHHQCKSAKSLWDIKVQTFTVCNHLDIGLYIKLKVR